MLKYILLREIKCFWSLHWFHVNIFGMYFFPDQIALVVQQLYRNSLLEIKRAFARTLPHKYKNSATIKIQATISIFEIFSLNILNIKIFHNWIVFLKSVWIFKLIVFLFHHCRARCTIRWTMYILKWSFTIPQMKNTLWKPNHNEISKRW